MRERLNNLARTIIDSNRYMALGTADTDGRPWVSPVWFASEDYKHFHWVSSPDARHSQNVAARPEVAIADLRLHGACRLSPGRVHVGPGRRTHRRRA